MQSIYACPIIKESQSRNEQNIFPDRLEIIPCEQTHQAFRCEIGTNEDFSGSDSTSELKFPENIRSINSNSQQAIHLPFHQQGERINLHPTRLPENCFPDCFESVSRLGNNFSQNCTSYMTKPGHCLDQETVYLPITKEILSPNLLINETVQVESSPNGILKQNTSHGPAITPNPSILQETFSFDYLEKWWKLLFLTISFKKLF